MKTNRGLAIQQGHRKRHPERVLHQFKQQTADTEHAESLFEQALMQEDDRVNIDDKFKVQGEMSLLSTQIGVTDVAQKNYDKTKNKLANAFLVGV